MKIRHPPGRAGRPWLAHRLEVARRGAELLDEKCRALAHERHRLEPLAADARRTWERTARDAERGLTRAAVLGGQQQIELARATSGTAHVEVSWRTILGVRCPVGARVAPPSGDEPVAPGGSAALLTAAAAHRAALEAAAQLAVLDAALRRIDEELRATALRRNAIQHRWIPAHEAAAAQLAMALEELEREDGTRVRWVTRGREGGSQAGPH